jgi:hypothetical protein
MRSLAVLLLFGGVDGLISPAGLSRPIRGGYLSASLSQIPIQSLDKKWRVIPDIWDSLAKIVPNETMIIDVIREPNQIISYAEAQSTITTIAASMQKLGIL